MGGNQESDEWRCAGWNGSREGGDEYDGVKAGVQEDDAGSAVRGD